MKVVPHSLPYTKELDGLRGVAILLVVLFHLWPGIFSFGFVGVDIFFVLSGYLITKIIVSKIEKGNFSLLQFYRNRIRRIFPALLLVLTVSLIIGYLLLFSDEFTQLGRHAKSSAFFYENFRLLGEVGYWDTSSQLKPLLHFWSLSIEEQFYIFWPILVIGAFYLRKQNLLFFVFLILFLVGAIIYTGDVESFYHSLSRFWELSLGALIVLIEKNKKSTDFICLYKWIVWPFFLFSILIFSGVDAYKPSHVLLLSTATALLILQSQFDENKILNNQILVFFGLISYPLYLWHYPLISFSHIFGISFVLKEWVIFLSSVLLALFTYRYIELYSRQSTNKIFIGSLFSLLLAVGLFGDYVKIENGLPERGHLTVSSKNMQKQFVREKSRDEKCLKLASDILNKNPEFYYCRATSDNPNKKFIAIIGDSHAHIAYPGFSLELKKMNYETILLSNTNCPSYVDGESGRTRVELKQCKKNIDEIYSVINGLKNISKIIISTRGAEYIKGKSNPSISDVKYKPIFFRTYFDESEKYNAEYEFFDKVDKTFKYFLRLNVPVYYLLENPELSFSPKKCLERPFNVFTVQCKVVFDIYDTRMKTYRERIFDLAKNYSNVIVLDPEKLFCDTEFCYGTINDKLMYADDNHLSLNGSLYQAKSLVGQILR